MKIRMNKVGQQTMSMPFGIIFAIILIVVFIVVAFIAVKHFLEVKDCAMVGTFFDDLKGKVGEAMSSQISDFEFSISLPSGIKQVCFADLNSSFKGNSESYNDLGRYSADRANVFVYPLNKGCNMPYRLLKNINITEITKTQNPRCFDASGKLRIKKDVYDRTVLIG